MPATNARTGPPAITRLSTSTMSGLNGQHSKPVQLPCSSYQTVAALVGESFEAMVGTVTIFSPTLTAAALAVSSALPPPMPIAMSAPCSWAIWATRSTSSRVESPWNCTSITSKPAASRLFRTVSPTMSFTHESHSTNGFLPSRAT